MVTVTLMVAGLAAWTDDAQKPNAKKQTTPVTKKVTALFTVSHPLSMELKLLIVGDITYYS